MAGLDRASSATDLARTERVPIDDASIAGASLAIRKNVCRAALSSSHGSAAPAGGQFAMTWASRRTTR